MKIRPLRDLCLVLLDAQESALSVLYLPDLCREQATTGEVIAVGPQCVLRVGDRVKFGKWNGTQLGDRETRELGYEPGRVFFMRTAAARACVEDHIYGVIS